MEDRNFTNPSNIGFHLFLFTTVLFNSFMVCYLSNKISPNLHSKFQLGVIAVNYILSRRVQEILLKTVPYLNREVRQGVVPEFTAILQYKSCRFR
jgi:hypothetical protein